MDENKDCDCAYCNGAPFEMAKWEAESLMEYGFFSHYVTGNDPQSPSGFNSHTHGLDLIGGFDFQITIPLKYEIISSIFHDLAARTKSGRKFSNGEILDDVLSNGYKCRLVLAEESERPVLRVIMPDPNGGIMPNDMDKNYRDAQYKDISSRE
jgi:hypothetical protein